MARKTYASTVLLYNDVPMEIVSELLGHSSMKITQKYYGKVVQKRVSEEMRRIAGKLKLLFFSTNKKFKQMGYIYQYTCSNCDKIQGEVAYGYGMLYPENNIDTRLFGCDDCGEVFSANINDIIIPCPKCEKNCYELELREASEKGFGEKINSKVKCPNCKKGTIQLKAIGLWD